MSYWLRLFGALVGGMSLLSLLHRHWPFKLNAFVGQLLSFYRDLFHPLARFIASLIGEILPVAIPADFIVFWSICGLALLRAGRFSFSRNDEPDAFDAFFSVVGPVLFASGVLRDGKSLKFLKDAGRWATIKMPAQRYGHLERSEVDQEVREMGQRWAGDQKPADVVPMVKEAKK
jgi:hypothetical protein